MIYALCVGFEKQEKHLPLQFILERLWDGDSVVLTGKADVLNNIMTVYNF